MSFGAEGEVDEEVRYERAQLPAPGSAGKAVGSASAEAEDELIRARAPTPQEWPRQPLSEQPSREHPGIEAPPLHDDQRLERDGAQGDQPRRSLLRRRPLLVAAALLLTVATAAAGYLYWDYSQHFESTDDSFVAARQFAIAPKVAGYLTAVPVTDNQHLSAGDVIARIDDRDYRIALNQAQAQLAHDQAVLAQAQKNLGRYQYLAKTDSIAQQQVDDQTFAVEQDQATIALDQANVDTAQLNLSHTVVTAAQPGRVVSLSAAVGQYAQPGTNLTMFVPDQIWINANFKETQLDAMRPDQPVTLTIDAYPDRTIRGHVASVQPGSGTAFSLLPAENATGNWVKVVQRVPVKIVMDDAPADVALGPGMSVETTVRVNPRPSAYEQLKQWIGGRL
ncbi:MAG TPA: HlyD family secretion protein [Xanthobacteraceae bacterium]|jgi:membrane fusion protein (multidrug efflux system)|nr:HlyD family secretion protein [Xanthobacteraceae bacterium]